MAATSRHASTWASFVALCMEATFSGAVASGPMCNDWISRREAICCRAARARPSCTLGDLALRRGTLSSPCGGEPQAACAVHTDKPIPTASSYRPDSGVGSANDISPSPASALPACHFPSQWTLLLESPALAGVRELDRQHWREPGDLFARMADAWPRLQRIHLCSESDADIFADGLLSALPRFQHLTDLRVDDVQSPPSCGSPVIGQCRSLTRLSLRALHDSLWHPVLSSPALSILRDLTLEDVCAHGIDCADMPRQDKDWSDIWRNLAKLERVKLVQCTGVALMLAPLADSAAATLLLPNLSHLDIKIGAFNEEELHDAASSDSAAAAESEADTQTPTVACQDHLLSSMLHHRPELHVRIDMSMLGVEFKFVDAATWKRVRDSFHAISLTLAGRMQLRQRKDE